MVYYESNYLCHYGLKGMKWGTRRWQYQDGRFNDAGKARYFGQNSSHRPDSVRALQGDPPKQNRTSDSSSNEKSKQSFDKEKAKNIAKNVAIGAAVVAGTALAICGAKKVHELGGISGTVKQITSKYHDLKIENLKANNEHKLQRLKINNEYKIDRLKAKNEYRQAKSKVVKEHMSKIKETLNDAKLERRMDRIDPTGKIDRKELRSQILDRESKARAVWEKTSGENNASINRRMRESRKSIDNFYKKSIASGGSIKSPAQIVSEYKRAHPGTKLSSSQIVKNYGGSGSASSSRKTPKLTLAPETFQAGAQFLSEFNKTVQTFKSTNQEQAQKAERGAKAVDDYTNGLVSRSKKSK